MDTRRLFRVFNELIFVLLGAFLVWLVVREQFVLAYLRSTPWIAIAVILVVLGVRAWMRAGRYTVRAEHYVRGASLALVGLLMLIIWRAPFEWIKPLLIAAGAVLILRGLLSTLLVVRN